jgi:hypothetical protein
MSFGLRSFLRQKRMNSAPLDLLSMEKGLKQAATSFNRKIFATIPDCRGEGVTASTRYDGL